mmetsp:Transcript_65408/g.189542  ORF Transcript_65408/g.189542 Transcript_65408/m.189542 type:complete len:216 (+) Transcript_65408:473-1120(+)
MKGSVSTLSHFIAMPSKSSFFSRLALATSTGTGKKPNFLRHSSLIARNTFQMSTRMLTTLVARTMKFADSSHRYIVRRTCITMPTMMLFTDTYLFNVSASTPWKNSTSFLNARNWNKISSSEVTNVAVKRYGCVLAKRSRICSISSLSSPNIFAVCCKLASMWCWKRHRATPMRLKCTSDSQRLSPVMLSRTSWSLVNQNSSTKTGGIQGRDFHG